MEKKLHILLILFCFQLAAKAQTYSLQDLESQFLENNLQLIANKFNVNKADALIVQEKLWANPSFTVDNINLWSNPSFETMPNIIGNYGSKQQVNMDLEQLIETAGKRKKRVAIKTLERNAARLEFEELLRQLKLELRTNFHSLGRIQLEEFQLNSIYELFTQLNSQYKAQSEKQHVSQVSYLRIHTELIGIQKELMDLQTEKNDNLQHLRILTQNPTLALENIDFGAEELHFPKTIPINLKETAMAQNITIQFLGNDINLSEKQFSLEKAQRTPNLNFLMNYERGGNVMDNFFGVGVNIDLPLFNRNKGNIQAAKIQVEQSQASLKAKQRELENEIDKLLRRLSLYESNLKQWDFKNNDIHGQVLENYIKHLQEKQVTLIEFIDFSQAYREAQQAYFELQENYLNTFEELQYLTGQEL